MKITRMCLAFLLFFITYQAYAIGTAEQLVSQCTTVPTKPQQAFAQLKCLGYVGGVLDTYSVISQLYKNVNLYCAPTQGIKIDTAISAVVDWLRKYPSKTNTPARSAVLLALREKYPCQ